MKSNIITHSQLEEKYIQKSLQSSITCLNQSQRPVLVSAVFNHCTLYVIIKIFKHFISGFLQEFTEEEDSLIMVGSSQQHVISVNNTY